MGRPCFCAKKARFIWLLTLFLAAAAPAFAASSQTKEKLSKVEDQLDEQRQAADALDEKAKEAGAALKTLQQKLIETTASIQARAVEQERLEDKLDELSQDLDAKTKDLKEERAKFNALTDALIELSRKPPEASFLQGGMTLDYIHRTIILRSVLPRLRDETDAIARDLGSLTELQEKMAEQKHLVIAAQANLQGQQRDLDQLIRTRQGLLQRTEAQKQSVAKQLASLSSEATDLRQLLEKVTPKGSKPSGKPSLSAALKPPVAGNLVRGFGVRDADGVLSQGLTYAGLPGSPVVAPRTGRVVFEGPFRGYGQILILQHDGGYHSFLAGFGRIDAEMGQEVDAGEPLGVLPLKNGRPELYFEWRHDNEPIDPAQGIALSKSQ